MYSKKIILFVFLILGASCAPITYQPNYISLLDLKYKLNTVKVSLSRNSHSGAGSLAFYQNFMSPILNSSCDHYPTDSRYARILFSNCSWPISIVKTSARYLSEPDSSKLYSQQTIEHNHSYYVDIPNRCSL